MIAKKRRKKSIIGWTLPPIDLNFNHKFFGGKKIAYIGVIGKFRTVWQKHCHKDLIKVKVTVKEI